MRLFFVCIFCLACCPLFAQSFNDSTKVYDFGQRFYDPRINGRGCPWLWDKNYKPSIENTPYQFAKNKHIIIDSDSIPDEFLRLLPDSLKNKLPDKKKTVL